MKKKLIVLTAILLISCFLLAESVLAVQSDLPIGKPIYRRCELSVGDFIEQCTLYTVPAGKIFVLEMVTAQVFTGAGSGPPFRLKLTDPQGNLAVANTGVPFKLEESSSTAQGRGYTVNQMVRLYYKENRTIQAYLLLQQAENFINEVSISGYLVDK